MKKFVGITKCPVGIAHTYMAAEKLQKAGQARGYEVKIETQGASGVEDELSAADVADADFVIIAAETLPLMGKNGLMASQYYMRRPLKLLKILIH
ncbi:fructose PTS transporter subunit IIB [Latilactobacillus curvatus]|nr:fructose PTS transporter subunit IIB [Latilactobacillus curvatus]MCP8849076.1 fructose PTS transporter subunit IIB [Latilactobacillus curvatus]